MSEPIEKAVEDFLNTHTSRLEKTKFLLACSGGVDSMVLAHLLEKLQCNFALVHCNFQLRGDASDKDQELVEAWAKSRNTEIFTRRFDTLSHQKEKGISKQMAARELRYGYFEELMKKYEFDYLLTAHHADDSLETILLNLGRGAGLSALAGINPVRGNILRPLWQQSKEALVAYAEKHKIPWREDASNHKADYQRNYIRLHVVPMLKKAFPNFESSFSKSLLFTNQDRNLFEELLREKLEKQLSRKREKEVFSLKDLSGKHLLPLLNFWLRDKGRFDLNAILNSLESGSGKSFESESHELLLDRDKLILRPKQQTEAREVLIQSEDRGITAPLQLELKTIPAKYFSFNTDPNIAALDYDKLKFPLKIRNWQEGDAFVPLGMKSHKKLSDFFIDEKLSLYEKEDAKLLTSGGEIAWIIGRRIDDRFKVTDKTKTIYFVRLLENDPND